MEPMVLQDDSPLAATRLFRKSAGFAEEASIFVKMREYQYSLFLTYFTLYLQNERRYVHSVNKTLSIDLFYNITI